MLQRILGLTLVLGALCVTASSASAASRYCGRDIAPLNALYVTAIYASPGTSCTTARGVAGRWRRTTSCQRTGNCSVAGFACRKASGSGESFRYRCRAGRRLVSFRAGS